MRKTKLPRRTPTWYPATTRWRGRDSEWLGQAWAAGDGFNVRLTCVRSLTRQPGEVINGHWIGDWIEVRKNLTVELQLIEAGYYERLGQIGKNDS